ncbi:MAG: CPBP family glutamic-type intramembrane protease [Cyanobacteria bacterium P01_E01_bin.48]
MGGYFIALMAISYAVKPELVNLNLAPSPSQLLAIALVAFAIPAFTEECVFRGLLTPAFELRWACLSTLAYVAWHPLEAYVFLPAALPLFTDATFLLLVALLGVLCWIACYRTRSLWASIILHWLVVVTWKAVSGTSFAF